MRYCLALIAAVLILFPAKADAAEFSGAYLIRVCASDAAGKEIVPGGHIACQGYISGVVDYHVLIRSLGTAPSVDFCIPEKTSLNTVQSIVFRYLVKNRKQHGSFVAAPGVALALFEAYPCKKKK
jgi:Rap1a immunity proteins